MTIKLGERLKDLRKANNLTQIQVAEKIGLTDSVVSFYERQERAPSPEVLVRFAELYHVSTDYLLGIEKNDDKHLNVAGLSEKEIAVLKEFVDMLRKKN